MSRSRKFVSLGLFIIDEFAFADATGKPTGLSLSPQERPVSIPPRFESSPAYLSLNFFQIGGGGTYATIGARVWLPASEVGMIIDKGVDFPQEIDAALRTYGESMWFFREQPDAATTRSLNTYTGDHRDFQYLTPRIRISPCDLTDTPLSRPTTLHFICSPARAADIMSQVAQVEGWSPLSIYEPIPVRCVPEELPALRDVLPFISVLSPNAEEALRILSLPLPPTKPLIEQACKTFLDFGPGRWIDPYWTIDERVVDVTGAGNSFLGGLAAGVALRDGDVYEAAFFAAISASYTIEQHGLPRITRPSSGVLSEEWNGDSPWRRLQELKARHAKNDRN